MTVGSNGDIPSRVDEVFAIMARRGEDAYLGENVTQMEHALQAAALAHGEGAGPELVAAALLHDIGHFAHEFPDDCADHGIDSRHQIAALSLLEPLFSDAVCRPVALHVDAKRYLCAVEPGYAATLSDASVHSLELQGGPMSPDECDSFESTPGAMEAVRLRRWDDLAKVPGADVPPLSSYRDLLISIAVSR